MTDQNKPAVHVTALSAIYKRKFNLGDYNSLEIESAIWAQPEPGDDPQAVLDIMWEIVKSNVKDQAMPVIKRYMVTNEAGEDIPLAATTTTTLNGKPLPAQAQAATLAQTPAKAQPGPGTAPQPDVRGAQTPQPQGQQAQPAQPAGQVETVKIDSFSIAYTQGGAPYISIKGGRYKKHGLALYDNYMPDEFLQAWPEWNTWTPQQIVTEIPEWMEFCYYDPQEKKIIGLAGRI